MIIKKFGSKIGNFQAYAAAGTLNQNYANILLLLLRLRQACGHPLLVKGFRSDPVGKLSSEMAQSLPRELLVNLYKLLEDSLAICLACKVRSLSFKTFFIAYHMNLVHVM